jgi:hypothetical protein
MSVDGTTLWARVHQILKTFFDAGSRRNSSRARCASENDPAAETGEMAFSPGGLVKTPHFMKTDTWQMWTGVKFTPTELRDRHGGWNARVFGTAIPP